MAARSRRIRVYDLDRQNARHYRTAYNTLESSPSEIYANLYSTLGLSNLEVWLQVVQRLVGFVLHHGRGQPDIETLFFQGEARLFLV